MNEWLFVLLGFSIGLITGLALYRWSLRIDSGPISMDGWKSVIHDSTDDIWADDPPLPTPFTELRNDMERQDLMDQVEAVTEELRELKDGG